MSLPDNGWLSEGSETGGTPFEGLLPVPYSGRYYEGADGTLLGTTEIDFSQISIIFELSFILERFGYGRSPGTTEFARMLQIDLVQAEVFGVILLDSFTPPAIANEFFEFPAYTQLACVGGEEASVPMYGTCQSGATVESNTLEGSPTMFTEMS